MRRLQNWQRLTGVLSLAVLLCVGVIAYLANKVLVLPYVVEVAESGQIRTVGLLPQPWRGETQAPVEAVVRQWLTDVRAITTDPVVFAQRWEDARQFMSPRGQQMLVPHIKEQYRLMQDGVAVQITFGQMLPIPGYERAYRVEWEERRFGAQGLETAKQSLQALLKIVIVPPANLRQVFKQQTGAPLPVNPLGIFIDEVNW